MTLPKKQLLGSTDGEQTPELNLPVTKFVYPERKACGLTVCVTCVWAGVDSVWEQENAEARKILENAAESHTSGARFVGQFLLCKTRRLKKRHLCL